MKDSLILMKPPNGALLPTAHFGVRQAGAALAHVARPAALFNALQQNAGALAGQRRLTVVTESVTI